MQHKSTPPKLCAAIVAGFAEHLIDAEDVADSAPPPVPKSAADSAHTLNQ